MCKQYSMCKDSSSKHTISRIKKILEDYNIEVEETFLNRVDSSNEVTSTRIIFKDLPNEFIGTNGKGINTNNALASGYAEFMERLQTRFLIRFQGDKYIFEPDEIITDNKTISQKSLAYSLLKAPKAINRYNYIMNISNCREFYFGANTNLKKNIYNKLKDKTIQVPFISVNDKNKHLLPISLLYCTQASTGMAAGNTYEEALVQGLSEICERFCMCKVITKGISLPSIPPKIYEEYSNLKKLKQYIEKHEIKITVKDASLGIYLPVVCTIFEDKKNNKTFSVVFGAHPYLPIAIERTFTEFLQGYDISNDDVRKKEVSKAKNAPKNVEEIVNAIFTQRTALEKSSNIYHNITHKHPNYSFDIDTWELFENSNQYMLKKLINRILCISKDIYIRDYSFLGFPTVYIYIPEVSDVINNVTKQKYLYLKNIDIEKWLKYIYSDGKAGTIEELYTLSKYISISSIPGPLVHLYCAIILGNKLKINKSIKLAKKLLFSNSKDYLIINIIEKYFNLKSKGLSTQEVRTILNLEFNCNLSEKVLIFINSLNSNVLLEILKKNPRSELKTSDKNIESKLNKLKSRLHIIYKDNMPSQQNIVDMLIKNNL